MARTPEQQAKLDRLAEKARQRRRERKAAEVAKEARIARLVGGEEPPRSSEPAAPPSTEAQAQTQAQATAEGKGPTAADVQAFAEPCKALWQSAAQLVSDDPIWRLSSQEVDTLAQASAPVAAKYLPTMAATPEALLAATALMVFGPKLIAAKKRERDEAKKASGKVTLAPAPEAAA